MPFLQLDLEQLVYGFFVVEGVHDCEVDDTAKVDQVRLCPVFYALFFLDGYKI